VFLNFFFKSNGFFLLHVSIVRLKVGEMMKASSVVSFWWYVFYVLLVVFVEVDW